MRKAKYSLLPHWAGETQTWLVRSSIATIPKFVGLKICFWPRLRANLLAMVTTAVRNASNGLLVRSSKQSESPEIRALRGSNGEAAKNLPQKNWVARTETS